MPVDIKMVRKIALSLDNAEEATSYGTVAFKVNGKLFARLHQDGESLIVRMDFDQREDFIASDPDTFFITDHYKNYEWLLIRMAKVDVDTLSRLLKISWNLRRAEKRQPSSSRKK